MGPLYGHLRGVVEALAGARASISVASPRNMMRCSPPIAMSRPRGRATRLAGSRKDLCRLPGIHAERRRLVLPRLHIRRRADHRARELVRPDRSPAEILDRDRGAVSPRSLPELTRRRKVSRRRPTGRRLRPRDFVDRIRHNGGIHDSIYAKPQLVDGESIMFCMRALLDCTRRPARRVSRAAARRRLVVTWICLWDVPLPPGSTLARYGFRSHRLVACDAPGAGYIHPWACSRCLTWWRSVC